LRGGLNDAPGIFAVSGARPDFFVGGALWTNPINTFLPQGRTPKTSSIGDTLSYTMGRHSFQFGANFQRVHIPTYDDGSTVLTYTLGMGLNQPALTAADFPTPISTTDLATANALLASLGGYIDSDSLLFNIKSRTSGFVPGATLARTWTKNNYA